MSRREYIEPAYEILGEKIQHDNEYQMLTEDIQRLSPKIEKLKELEWTNLCTDERLEKIADNLITLSNSNIERERLIYSLKRTYEAAKDSLVPFYANCCSDAVDIYRKTDFNVSKYNYAEIIMSEIQSTPIFIAPENMEKYTARFCGGFPFKLSTSRWDLPLDKQIVEWYKKYPSIFAGYEHEDAIEMLIMVMESLKRTSEYYQEYYRDNYVEWFALEIYDQYWKILDIDSYDVKFVQLTQEHNNVMEILKLSCTQKFERQKDNFIEQCEVIYKHQRGKIDERREFYERARVAAKKRLDDFDREIALKTQLEKNRIQQNRSTQDDVSKNTVTKKQTQRISLIKRILSKFYSTEFYRELCYKKLAQRKDWMDKGIITQDEYDKMKAELLKKLNQ